MTTTQFPQPIDHMTRKNLRVIARYFRLSYIDEQSHNSQRKETLVAAIKAA